MAINMNHDIKDLPRHLSSLSQHDVCSAFRQAYDSIEQEQNRLRIINPENPLLGLVHLHENREGCEFSANYKSRVMEHTDEARIPSDATYYFLIGRYIELLREEQEHPKFVTN